LENSLYVNYGTKGKNEPKPAEGKKGGVNTYGTEKTPTGFKKPGNHWNLN